MLTAKSVFDLLLTRCEDRREQLREAELYLGFEWNNWWIKLAKTVRHGQVASLPRLKIFCESERPLKVHFESEVWPKETFELEPDCPALERQLVDLLDRWLERCGQTG